MKYFISFTAMLGLRAVFGNCGCDYDETITDTKDIDVITKIIEKDNPLYSEVIILQWKRFKE